MNTETTETPPALAAQAGSGWEGHIEFRGGFWWVAVKVRRKSVVLRRCEIRQQAMRYAAGMTQGELAKAIGISQSFLCKIETGDLSLTQEIAERIERATSAPNKD